MQRPSSKNIGIASLVMGLALSTTASAKNLLCLTLDGTGANDAIAILSINTLGEARGALCYMDLASTTTLEKCHVVTGTATGKNPVRIGVQGVDLADGHGGTLSAKATHQPLSAGFSGSQLQSTQGAFTYTPTPGSTESSGSVGAPDAGTVVVTSSADPLVYSASPRSVAAASSQTVVVTNSVSGPVTAVRCTANKLKGSRDVQIITKTPVIGTYIAPADGVVDGILFP